MRRRKLLFTLLAAATLMINISVWAESNSEIENYTRYTDYEPQPVEPAGLFPGEGHQDFAEIDQE